MRLRLILLIIILNVPIDSLAKTFTAASCSQADVTTAYNAAVPGDTLFIPSGNCTWDSTLTISKQVTIIGAGDTSTIINRNKTTLLSIWPESDIPIRISGIGFVYSTNINGDNCFIAVHGPKNGIFGLTKIRIDHCKFTKGGRQIYIFGWVYGVIDNNVFLNANVAIGLNGDDTYSWKRSIEAGTANAMFIEDNTFITDNDSDTITQSYMNEQIYPQQGARVVTRYNTFDATAYSGNFSYFQSFHGNQNYYTLNPNGLRATPIAEVYENTIHIRTSYSPVIGSRGGSILIYNNDITFDTGTPQGIVLTEEEGWQTAFFNPLRTVWPAEDQIYNTFIWGNTLNGSPLTSILSSGKSDPIFIQENRDYFMHAPQASGGYEYFSGRPGASNQSPTTIDNGTMVFSASGANAYYPYTAYTYPHPLRSGAVHPPAKIWIPK